MSISRWVEEIITDVPDERRRVLIGLGHIMDSVAEGHSEAAERGLRQALWAVQKNPGNRITLPADDDLIRFRDTVPPNPDWVIEGLKPGDVGVITAPGGLGKSMLCLVIAQAVAVGLPLFGQWRVGDPGDVWYFYAEDSATTMHRRLHALGQIYPTALGNDVLARMHFKAVRSRPPKLVLRGDRGLITEQQDVLHALLNDLQQQTRPRLILLDPLIKFHVLDENSNDEMNQFLETLGRLAESTKTAVIFTHHTAKGKNTDTDHDAQESARGAGAIINEARWQAALYGLTAKQQAHYGIGEKDAWKYLTLTTPKRNNVARLPDLFLVRGPGGIL